MSTTKLVLMTALCWALALACKADAGVPDADTVYAPLTVCISPYVIAHDRAVFARAAHDRGYDVFVGHSKGCAVTLFVSDADWVDVAFVGYDEARTMHRGRATDLIVAWEARLPR